MNSIRKGDTGAAVEDVQERLALLELLPGDQVSGVFDDATAAALGKFCESQGIPPCAEVTSKVWAALVDATYHMGDRTLYLRMPYLHGNDVLELQRALGALGFACGKEDGIFGATTELALRKFQVNMGLPSDGIAGAYTFAALRTLFDYVWENRRQQSLGGMGAMAAIISRNGGMQRGALLELLDTGAVLERLRQAVNPELLDLRRPTDLNHMLAILLSVTGPLLYAGIEAGDAPGYREHLDGILDILQRGMGAKPAPDMQESEENG